jgi:hypothetical protein
MQILERLIDQHCRPKDAFEKSQHAQQECGGMGEVIYPRVARVEHGMDQGRFFQENHPS